MIKNKSACEQTATGSQKLKGARLL